MFDKDTRKKIVELKRKRREIKNADCSDVVKREAIERIEMLISELIDKSKKKTEEYKSDKNEKRKDKRLDFYRKVSKYMDSKDNRKTIRKLDIHDLDMDEFYADLGSMKHGRDKEYTIKTQRDLDKNMRKYGIGSKEAHNTNVARRETRNDLKKRGLMNYVESFDN